MSELEKDEEPTVSDHRGGVPIRIPANMKEMLEHFFDNRKEVVGWCLLCDTAIRTEDDLLPGTSTHNCERGRALEAAAALAQAGRPAPPEI